MANLRIITIGSDGPTDFIAMPDGTRFTLGAVSVLKLVTSLAKSGFVARRVLDAFLDEGQAVMSVDEDRLWGLLTPVRKRWAGVALPLIRPLDRTSTEGFEPMTTPREMLHHLNAAESHVVALMKAASTRAASQGEDPLSKASVQAEITGLRAQVAAIHLTDFGDQSKNDAFVGLGQPKVDTVEDGYTPPASVSSPKTAQDGSFATLQENTAIAETIHEQVTATAEKVAKLVSAGKKFNHVKANQDLHAVESRLASLLSAVDLGVPWARKELDTLAVQANHLHGLFASAKV